MAKEELDKKNVQGKPLLSQRTTIDRYIAGQEAAGKRDEATGKLYNEGTFVREAIEKFFLAESESSGVSEEQFAELTESVNELRTALNQLGFKFNGFHEKIQHDLAQFYTAILLNPELQPDGERAKELHEEILDRIFPNK